MCALKTSPLSEHAWIKFDLIGFLWPSTWNNIQLKSTDTFVKKTRFESKFKSLMFAKRKVGNISSMLPKSQKMSALWVIFEQTCRLPKPDNLFLWVNCQICAIRCNHKHTLLVTIPPCVFCWHKTTITLNTDHKPPNHPQYHPQQFF